MWAHPDVFRHIGGVASTRTETWGRILRYAGLWPILGYGYWAIEERATGRFVGDLGFADFKREIDPRYANVPEAGWVLAPAVRGRGYASEALVAALGWSDEHLDAHQTFCLIAPANQASIRVAEKAGYRAAESLLIKGQKTLAFERTSRRFPPNE